MSNYDDLADKNLTLRWNVIVFLALVLVGLSVIQFLFGPRAPYIDAPEGTVCADGSLALPFNPARGIQTSDWMVNEPALTFVCPRAGD